MPQKTAMMEVTSEGIAEAIEYIRENTYDSHTSWEDDWGYGQMDFLLVVLYTLFARKEGFSFRYYREVTALCDIIGDYNTIKAVPGKLFMYHSGNPQDMSHVWEKVRAVEKPLKLIKDLTDHWSRLSC